MLTYLGFATILFAPALGSSGFGNAHVGPWKEATLFIWRLTWWPYAITHHLNPFISTFIFAPTGLNLTWTPSIPLLALVAWPLTAVLGPIATYNLLCLVCPALAAWSAFLLCRHVSGGFWPPLLAGWIFGFSPFVIGNTLGAHMMMFGIFIVPLVVLVALLRLEDRITARAFTLWLCGLIAGEFLIFSETFTTMTFAGGLALLTGWLLARGATRRRIGALFLPVVLAYLGAAVLVSPFLYYLLAGYRTRPFHSAQEFSADLLNLVFPTSTTALWRVLPLFGRVSSRFVPNLFECDAYAGLPLLGVAAWFAIRNRRTLAGRLCTVMLLVTMVAAIGSVLHVGGARYWPMPWRLIGGLPLLNQVLPIRFCLYTFLILALMASMWLRSERLPIAIRLTAAALIVASLCPKLLPSEPNGSWRIPAFVRDGIYRGYLRPGETVAMLPLVNAWKAGCMSWQAESGMYFRLAAGYQLVTPTAYMRWPAVRASLDDYDLPDPVEQWKAFLAGQQASALIVVRGDSPDEIRDAQALEPLLAALGAQPARFGHLSFYRIPAATLAPYRGVTAVEMEQWSNAERFTAVMLAAHRYLAAGGPVADLSPLAAAQRGLIPTRWLYGRRGDGGFRDWLGGAPDGRVSVGVFATGPAIGALIDRFGGYADEVRYPYPAVWGQVSVPTDATPHWLTMIFKPAGLERAVALAKAQQPRLVRNPGRPPAGAAAADATPW